jgi:hypothetical protein
MLETINKFLHLPAPDRRILIQSVLFLGAIRVGLWLLPFRTLRHLLAKIAYPSTAVHALDRTAVDTVTWAVGAAGRYLPGTPTCLPQALTTQVLLRRRGHPACLRIGVARGERGALQAHAWVESDGRVVSGSIEDLARFAPLPPLEREGP